MPYSGVAEEPKYNTDITREHFYKYRPDEKRNYALSLWIDRNDKDILQKGMVGVFNGGLIGAFAASHANFRHRGRFTVMSIAEKSFRHGTPFVLMGATYGVTVGLLTNFRQKECPLNHMIAGCAAGSILGSWYKWPMLGLWTGIILGVASGSLKLLSDNDALGGKPLRRQRLFNMYRRGWFTERPNAEGKDDADQDVSFRSYRP